jgi:uncharacterized membrane protein
MTVMAAEAPRLDIAKVIGATFGVLGRNFIPFAGLTVLMVGAPMAIIGFGAAGLIADPTNLDLRMQGFGAIGLGVLVYIVTTAMLQGALIYGTVRDLNGQRATFGECLATGLRAFLPLILVSILMWLGIVAGLMLFLVPGVMLGVAWCVAVPAQVSERTGIVSALGRSAELTRGNRWRIFGLVLLFVVLGWIVSALVTPFSLAVGSMGPSGVLLSQMLTNAVSTVVNTLVGATGASVLYAELRRLKEGLAPDALAALFD